MPKKLIGPWWKSFSALQVGQPYGGTATNAMSMWVAGKAVEMDVRDADGYGRLVGVVYVNGTNVNAEMVCSGHACWYRQCAQSNQELRKCEKEARGVEWFTAVHEVDYPE